MQAEEPFWRRQAASLEDFLRRIDQRGFVTLVELAEVLPDGPADPDEVEDFMQMVSARGVCIVEDT